MPFSYIEKRSFFQSTQSIDQNRLKNVLLFIPNSTSLSLHYNLILTRFARGSISDLQSLIPNSLEASFVASTKNIIKATSQIFSVLLIHNSLEASSFVATKE